MGGVYCDCIVSRNVTQFSASHVIDLQKAGAHSWELSQWGYWAESNLVTKVTNKMQLHRLIYYSQSALHVSSNG